MINEIYKSLFVDVRFISSKSSEETQKNNKLRNDETKTVKGKAICFMDAKVCFVFLKKKSGSIQSCYQAGFEIQRKMISLHFKSCLVNDSI